ncbi:hypothetical protein RJ640_003823 [Escallonia rubra]|uniref:Transcription elongation factor 1 homolog n=1 Tax=Escallonia rubra TaxID=112253 RepID=A0AA88RWI3_9ASTE|nr:hypothetical protein RJ640_003823 [Escallonia rubra]
MGKRKTRSKQITKKQVKLDTTFRCPFCNHGDSVEYTIFYKESLGKAKCSVCLESYNTNVTPLTHAIDIYNFVTISWIVKNSTAFQFRILYALFDKINYCPNKQFTETSQRASNLWEVPVGTITTESLNHDYQQSLLWHHLCPESHGRALVQCFG